MVFASAREFLANANVGTRPAWLVLDIELPDVKGLQLQRELGAALPIIFITGHGDIAMTVQAMKAGACDFLPKPVSDAALLHAIEQALERSRRNYASRCELDKLRSAELARTAGHGAGRHRATEQAGSQRAGGDRKDDQGP